MGDPPPPPPPAPVRYPNVSAPAALRTDGDLATNWTIWKQMWGNYAVISGLNTREADFKVAMFLHAIGEKGLKIFNGLQFETEAEKQDINVIIDKFDTFTIGERNETYDRYVFNNKKQEDDESIDAYVAELHTLAKHCNFQDLHDSLIKDRIVLGVADPSTKKKLLEKRNLDLKECINICRAAEATDARVKDMAGATSTIEVNRVETKTGVSYRSKGEWQKRQGEWQKRQCKFCGYQHILKKDLCPAWGKDCNKCGKKGHFSKMCLNKQQVHSVIDNERKNNNDESDDAEFLAYVQTSDDKEVVYGISEGFPKSIHSRFIVNHKEVKFQVDCGASVNILPRKFLSMNDKITPTSKRLIMWNNSELNPDGTSRLVIKNKHSGKKYSVEFMIVSANLTPLIGAKTAQQMKLITVNDDCINLLKTENMNRYDQLITEFNDVFSDGLGKLQGTVKLSVDPKVQPSIQPPRNVPIALKNKFATELQRLITLEVIKPVDEPTEWVSSYVTVVKKSGDLRICADPKALNTALLREHYKLPTLDDVLPELSRAKVFSTVDLRSAYWHCILDEESSKLTTFNTPQGRYRWLRLPYGVTPASEIFQKRLNMALEGLKGIACIADDILIYGVGETTQQALDDQYNKLHALFVRCRKIGIRLNKDKLNLCATSVPFMGHLATEHGIKVDE